jgi:DNA-binding MurR/RpiR family transcriptional regulator
MLTIDFSKLNQLEIQIHNKLNEYAKSNDTIRISTAAELCGCSVSKISKFAQKLGFSSFRQYLDFLQGRDIQQVNLSNELTRVRQYIDDFNGALVDELLELIDKHNKIVFFGYGPSLLCAQYFEYRLRLFTSKTIIAVADEISVGSMTDKDTLLILLTVTGTFHSFETVYAESKKRGCEVAMIVEEYNTELFSQCDRIFWLCNYPQSDKLLPYEKSRTVFFIFFEEVIQRFLTKKYTDRLNQTSEQPETSS